MEGSHLQCWASTLIPPAQRVTLRELHVVMPVTFLPQAQSSPERHEAACPSLHFESEGREGPTSFVPGGRQVQIPATASVSRAGLDEERGRKRREGRFRPSLAVGSGAAGWTHSEEATLGRLPCGSAAFAQGGPPSLDCTEGPGGKRSERAAGSS